ncbi:hypothetical protein R0J90_22215, partial [Micrococcus sp. SIMBA_144]
GAPADYVASHALDLGQFTEFISATQPDLVEPLGLASDTPTRHKVLARLQGEITRRGVVHILRNGIDHLGLHVDLYYPAP